MLHVPPRVFVRNRSFGLLSDRCCATVFCLSVNDYCWMIPGNNPSNILDLPA